MTSAAACALVEAAAVPVNDVKRGGFRIICATAAVAVIQAQLEMELQIAVQSIHNAQEGSCCAW